MIDLYLIRHGESIRNIDPSTIGGRSVTAPLTPNGENQAKCIGKQLRGVEFDKIAVSAAKRTRQTHSIAVQEAYGDALYNGVDVKKTYYSDSILELDQGDWEGENRAEKYNDRVMRDIKRLRTDFTPPNGESQREVGLRMENFLEWFIGYKEQDLRIALFGHGLAIKCYLQRIMRFNEEWIFPSTVSNASITRLQYKNGLWGLKLFNWTPHDMDRHPLH